MPWKAYPHEITNVALGLNSDSTTTIFYAPKWDNKYGAVWDSKKLKKERRMMSLSRPKSKCDRQTRKKLQELVNEETLYKTIQAHPLLKDTDIKLSEIRLVFKAFADIMLNSVKMNLRVNLPFIGEFYRQKMNGFKGGNVTIMDEPFKKDSKTHIEYRPPKPDYYLLQFEIRKSVKDKFKNDTQDI